MDDHIKRRTFIAAAVSTMLAAPFAARYFVGEKPKSAHKNYGKELARYQSMVDVPIQSIEGPATFSLGLRPQAGKTWNYVIFSPSFLPNEMALAAPGQPDVFAVREGRIGVGKTLSDQTVIYGEDEFFKICSPKWTDERSPADFALLLQDGKLIPAKEKGTVDSSNRDTQFDDLLALNGIPTGELALGRKWKSGFGRIKPFKYTTNYEIAGFAEIDRRKTVNIRFHADIPNLASGISSLKLEKGQTLTNTHSGNAWFDLDTGLLVRQEVDLKSVGTKVDGTDNDLSVEGKFIVQLYTA